MSRYQHTLITCSYGPDYERCRRLCASTRRYLAENTEHVLVVPRRDCQRFAELAHDRTRIISVQSLMPAGTVQLPMQSRWWLLPGCLPIRGWIMQQLAKIAAAALTRTETAVFIDSDAEFVRPFDPEVLWEHDQLRLLRVERGAPSPRHRRWSGESAQLLGIEPADWYGADYVGQLVAWRPDTVRELTALIERTTGRTWRRALGNTLHFSEYLLYGIYVDQVLDGAGHRYDPDELCHCSWHYTEQGRCDLDDFFSHFGTKQVAVHIQSNLGIDPDIYAQHVQRLRADAT